MSKNIILKYKNISKKFPQISIKYLKNISKKRRKIFDMTIYFCHRNLLRQSKI